MSRAERAGRRLAAPAVEALAEVLECILGPNEVRERKPNSPSGTFPAEIVTCRLVDGREVELFCKYSAGKSHRGHGHRGDVAYEAEVYTRVLAPLGVSTPRLLGVHAKGGETWLLLEYVRDHVRLKNSHSVDDLGDAAAWIGAFHALTGDRLADPELAFVTRYDADYYAGWLRRTRMFVRRANDGLAWLDDLCGRPDELADVLLSDAPCVIHGEYYPPNVLISRGLVRPVDWESAAVGAGEIDLVSLFDGWPDDFGRRCRVEYANARWPAGPPADFEERLSAARLYLHLRWLGDRPSWIQAAGWRLDEVRSLSEQLGVL